MTEELWNRWLHGFDSTDQNESATMVARFVSQKKTAIMGGIMIQNFFKGDPNDDIITPKMTTPLPAVEKRAAESDEAQITNGGISNPPPSESECPVITSPIIESDPHAVCASYLKWRQEYM